VQLSLRNAAFMACNANVNLDRLLTRAAPSCRLQSASIQFPDPWFKVKHHKRRVVKPPLVTTLADHLQPGGWLWMQSDVHEVALDMREVVRETEPVRLRDVTEDIAAWDPERPALLRDVTTERERASANLERPVYRCLFIRE